MTDEQRQKIRLLNHCVFLPGSYDKIFIRNLAGLPAGYELSKRQVKYIDQTFHRLRAQIGANYHDQLCGICHPEPQPIPEMRRAYAD